MKVRFTMCLATKARADVPNHAAAIPPLVIFDEKNVGSSASLCVSLCAGHSREESVVLHPGKIEWNMEKITTRKSKKAFTFESDPEYTTSRVDSCEHGLSNLEGRNHDM